MKHSIKITFLGSLFIVAIGCFLVGIIFIVKNKIPKEGHFEIAGYFSNIKRNQLTIFDYDDYAYFTKGTGASEAEGEDYKNHPENYEEYVVDLVVTNLSNYDFHSVWAVSPGYQYHADTSNVSVKKGYDVSNRSIWINCWMSEGVTSLLKEETFRGKLKIIIKKSGMSDQEIRKLLMNMKVNLQLVTCYGSQKDGFKGINSNTYFYFPVYYNNKGT